MADRSLINLWLLDADAAVGGLAADQIAWLKKQRLPYSAAVKSGDWEVNSTTREGTSASSKRGVSDKDNHDAIVAALTQLGADLGVVEGRPGILIPTFEGITN